MLVFSKLFVIYTKVVSPSLLHNHGGVGKRVFIANE